MSGINAMERTGNFFNNTLRYALIGAVFGLLFPVVATLIRLLVSGLPVNSANIAAIHSAEPLLWIIDTAPVFLSLFAIVAGRRQDALEQSNSLLKSREQQLEQARQSLEGLVNERTDAMRSLNSLVSERLDQLQSVAEISRALLTIQKMDRLLSAATEMIGQKFHFYHVGIYLLDEQKQQVVLEAASSEGGQNILQRGQRLAIGGQNLVEFVIRSGQPRVVADPESDTMFSKDAELPNTRSAIIIPLKSGEAVIGALDLQADESRTYSGDLISILSILADQVSIAIQNAESHERTNRTLREVEAGSRQLSASQWKGWVESLQARGYRYDGIRSEPLKEAAASTLAENKVQNIPILLRGQTIGSLKVKLSETQVWSEDDLAIAQATAERAALALEGARLLEDAQRRATREAFLSDMAAKLGTSFQLDSILRDTVEELGRSLEGATVSFQLINPSAPPKMDTTRKDEPSSGRDSSGQPI